MKNNTYIPTDPVIRNMIHSFWEVDHITSFEMEYIMPKGVVEIIFNLSNCSPIVARLNGNAYKLPDCFINGFNTTPIELHLPERQLFFGVLFQPLAVKQIFGNHASAFSDITVDLSLIDPAFHSLWHQLADQDNFKERVSVFLAWTIRNSIECQPREQFMNSFLYSIDCHNLSVNDLASSLCYSPRHLSRKIFEATGMNTEELLRYKKYLHALHLIHHTDLALTEIAYQSQFSDQSHFIKTFRAYANMTPGEYKCAKGFVKGHLYKDVRKIQFARG